MNKGIRNYFLEENKVIELSHHCHLIKKYYVEKDEFDQLIRRKLNLGHSFGHAIEKLLNYIVPHGVAVMHGIYMAYLLDSQVSVNKERVKETLVKELIIDLIKTINNETIYTTEFIQSKINLNIDDYLSILKRDKKNNKNNYKLVLLSNEVYLKEFDYLELKNYLPKIITMIRSIVD